MLSGPAPDPGSSAYGLRQVRPPHEVAVALAGGAAAFVEGPHDEALAAAAVAGSEDAGDALGVFFEVGFHVAARVALDAERVEQRLLGSEKTDGVPAPALRFYFTTAALRTDFVRSLVRVPPAWS